ncbi:hypothetical protein [Achromobacter sp.]|uniref:hypothetical protein n=1 Tax=Achromobacter sp. TaxID=134375 RepID=UPI0028A768D5|nr:hypothetical protein [Achromobacter sp.]
MIYPQKLRCAEIKKPMRCQADPDYQPWCARSNRKLESALKIKDEARNGYATVKAENGIDRPAELFPKLTVKPRNLESGRLIHKIIPTPNSRWTVCAPRAQFTDPTIIFLALPLPRHHPYGRGVHSFM